MSLVSPFLEHLGVRCVYTCSQYTGVYMYMYAMTKPTSVRCYIISYIQFLLRICNNSYICAKGENWNFRVMAPEQQGFDSSTIYGTWIYSCSSCNPWTAAAATPGWTLTLSLTLTPTLTLGLTVTLTLTLGPTQGFWRRGIQCTNPTPTAAGSWRHLVNTIVTWRSAANPDDVTSRDPKSRIFNQ